MPVVAHGTTAITGWPLAVSWAETTIMLEPSVPEQKPFSPSRVQPLPERCARRRWSTGLTALPHHQPSSAVGRKKRSRCASEP
jgi:hypothetical protein